MTNYLENGLRQDHTAICEELEVLKMAEVSDGPPTWQTLRDVCSRLVQGLLTHIEKEEQMPVHPSSDHHSDYRYLQVITRYITLENRPFLLNNRYQLLKDFLRGFHRHTEAQEAELFLSIQPELSYSGATVL